MDITTLDQFKDEIYGVKGTPRRDNLERELETLRIGVQIRNARQKKEMTQAQLAERINKKRTFISKVENDGGNLTLKTLIDIVERGLGGKLNIEVKFKRFRPGDISIIRAKPFMAGLLRDYVHIERKTCFFSISVSI